MKTLSQPKRQAILVSKDINMRTDAPGFPDQGL